MHWPATATRIAPAGPPLRLPRAPEAFVALAAEDSPLGKQAAAVLTRVSWPGKPGDRDAPPALTTAEQRQFEAGRRIYEAMCQACHQADGRGQPGRAASLVGRRWRWRTPTFQCGSCSTARKAARD